MRWLNRNAPSGETFLVAGLRHAGRRLVSRNADQRLELQEVGSQEARQLDGNFSLGEK